MLSLARSVTGIVLIYKIYCSATQRLYIICTYVFIHRTYLNNFKERVTWSKKFLSLECRGMRPHSAPARRDLVGLGHVQRGTIDDTKRIP